MIALDVLRITRSKQSKHFVHVQLAVDESNYVTKNLLLKHKTKSFR